ncbi:MAG: DUF6089 family protein [Ginsengibacter sp.]
MRILILTIVSTLVSLCAASQKVHLDLFAGVANYQGDLQDKRFTFSQSHLAGGVGLSYDFTKHISARAGFMISSLSGDDQLGRNQARNLDFKTKLSEVNLALQYDITALGEHLLTPYVFGGIAIYHFNPYTYDTSGNKFYLQPLSTEGEDFVQGVSNYKLTQLAIPFGAGVKLSLSENLSVGLELGIRKLFTDKIDDLSSTYVDETLLLANRGPKAVELAYRGGELKNGGIYPPAGTLRGGAKNKDWYYFTGFRASLTLFNGGIGGGGKHSKYGCPVNVSGNL